MNPAALLSGMDLEAALARVSATEGFFYLEEARLLMAAAAKAIAEMPPPCDIVEVGSYCGRSTIGLASVAKHFRPGKKVKAVDPHLGDVSIPQGTQRRSSTWDRFLKNIASAGVADAVEPIRKASTQFEPSEEIGLLFIDGLHDYDNVSRDFQHLEPWVGIGGFVAFHDTGWPGVMRLVGEAVASGRFEELAAVRSLKIFRKLR